MNYIEKLRKSAEETGSIACMGLDPVIAALPKGFANVKKIPHFMREVFREMENQNVLPGAFKPNQGFYLRNDEPLEGNGSDHGYYEGSKALARVIKTIRSNFEGIPICLDYKRGDIAKSSDNYAVEGFKSWEADAVTAAPYMGFDSVLPFAGRNPKNLEEAAKYCNDESGKGVYVLVRTSNLGAKDFQNLKVLPSTEELEKLIEENLVGEVPEGESKFIAEAVIDGSMPLYMAVASKVIDWAKNNPGIGAVIGATYLKELDEIARLIVSSGVEVPLLIPGIGKPSQGGQGGSADEVVAVLKGAEYPLELARINSSSGLLQPWAKKKEPAPDDFAKVTVANLAELNELIGYKHVA